MGFVTSYEVRGQSYFHIRNWSSHQRVDKPGKPRVPGPEHAENSEVVGVREDVAKHSRDSRETLAPDPIRSDPTTTPMRESGGSAPVVPSIEGGDDSWRAALGVLQEIHEAHAGRATYDPSSWRRELLAIAAKPIGEVAGAIKTYGSDDWVRSNPGKAHPGHLLKHWARYAGLDAAPDSVVDPRPIRATAADLDAIAAKPVQQLTPSDWKTLERMRPGVFNEKIGEIA
jgi:hypothetical protein